MSEKKKQLSEIHLVGRRRHLSSPDRGGGVVTSQINRFGATAMQYAALNSVHGKELVEFFFSKGLCEKKTDERGLLPLQQALRVKNMEAAKELVQCRRDERKHRDLMHSSVFEFAKHDASLFCEIGNIGRNGPGGLFEMSIQKDLCLICERPTADGAIFAVHVDKEKLQEWFLNVCGHELAEKVEDDDKICYFCAWQAEFLWNFDGMSDDDLVWWPRILDFDDAARELRKCYFEGIVEQCWVQLEEVNLPESEEDETEKEEAESKSETHSNIFSEKKKCLYCDKLYKFSSDLSKHVKKRHKNAIRCDSADVPTLTDRFGATALHYAALNPVHGKELVELFVSKGLCVEERVRRGLLPLPHALSVKNMEAAMELLQRRRDKRKHRDLLHFSMAKTTFISPNTMPVLSENRPFRSKWCTSACPGGLSKMSIQKALCLICERPTADGTIFAVHVDKEKLQTWFLNVSGHELADQVKDEDKICYFCAWQAEFLWEFDGMEDDDLVWWPRNSDFDDAARELRTHYFEGNVEQCWVQLEDVDLPEREEYEVGKDEVELESETRANIFSQKKKCLYCGKMSVKISNFLQSVWLDDVNTCRRLIEAGAVVTTLTDRFGATALHYAALNLVHGKELVEMVKNMEAAMELLQCRQDEQKHRDLLHFSVAEKNLKFAKHDASLVWKSGILEEMVHIGV
ncbi:Hypothetical predicted protein [Cloeon dipterum]|uniref:C2H2-type domain-containing protein n=1 Tax=Cloeon dipterum TaxID=197152 RepID=A0A8S1DMZ4_9INSE|nr:Hypothetical predicted protein [Cloeon dipterum]